MNIHELKDLESRETKNMKHLEALQELHLFIESQLDDCDAESLRFSVERQAFYREVHADFVKYLCTSQVSLALLGEVANAARVLQTADMFALSVTLANTYLEAQP